MTIRQAPITLVQARAIAEASAKQDLSPIFGPESSPYLRSDYTVGAGGWIFYRRKELMVPEQYWARDMAYAVTKSGGQLSVRDWSDIPEKAQALADKLRDLDSLS